MPKVAQLLNRAWEWNQKIVFFRERGLGYRTSRIHLQYRRTVHCALFKTGINSSIFREFLDIYFDISRYRKLRFEILFRWRIKKSENVSEFPNFSLDFKIPDTFGSPEHGLGDEVRRRTIGKIRFLVSASNVLFVFFLPWVHFFVLYSVFANLAEIKPHGILH